MAGFTDSIAIKASKERVFEVISDFAKYPKFIPEVEDVKVHAQAEAGNE